LFIAFNQSYWEILNYCYLFNFIVKLSTIN
jgi:hypothetical protein